MKITFKNIKITIAAGLYIVMAAVAIPVVTPPLTVNAACGGHSSSSALLPTWYDGLLKGAAPNEQIVSPKDCATGSDTGEGIRTFVTIIALNIVQIMLYIVGYVSLGFIIWGGFKYIISGENANGTSAAKKTIQNAVIGMIIAIASVAIVKFVAGAIVK